MKINKRTIGVFFIVAIALLLFFSKTIYTYNLPEVTGTKPFRGSLDKLEISSGAADYADIETVYAAVSGNIGIVSVTEGDRVSKGQELFRMDYKAESIERKIKELENNIKKLQLDIRNNEIKLERTADIAKLETEKANRVLNGAELSFEFGAISKNDLLLAKENMDSVNLKYDGEQKDLQFSLDMKNAELNNLFLELESYRDILTDYRTYAVITSPADGMVTSLNVEKGMYVTENAPVVSIGIGAVFVVDSVLSPDNNFVISGDTCYVSNTSHELTGTVSRVYTNNGEKLARVIIDSTEVSAGESFEIQFAKNSASLFTLVPNGSLNQDNDGYFVYQIKRRKGIMGDEYYIERLNVYIGDSDYQNTVIIRGITFFEPIVLVSDKTLAAGDRISLKNVGDFFES